MLVDLFTEKESEEDRYSGAFAFRYSVCLPMVPPATCWSEQNPRNISVWLNFGASTGAAAASEASIQTPKSVKAIVSRGAKADLAGDVLKDVSAPILELSALGHPSHCVERAGI